MRCSIWRDAAENVAESLQRGTRVIVSGRLKSGYETKEGEKRTVVEMDVDEVGPSLRYANAKVTKTSRGGGSGDFGGGGFGGQQGPVGHRWFPPAGGSGGQGGWGGNSGSQAPAAVRQRAAGVATSGGQGSGGQGSGGQSGSGNQGGWGNARPTTSPFDRERPRVPSPQQRISVVTQIIHTQQHLIPGRPGLIRWTLQ